MWFTKSFRTIWWFFLIVLLSIFIKARFLSFASGNAKPIDFLVFVTWIGVCLGPLFAEIQLPGITLKQKIEETKKELSKDINSLRSEIRNSVDIRSQVSPNIWVGGGFQQPPPDNKLEEIEQRLHSAIDRLEQQGYQIDSVSAHKERRTPSDDEIIMFSTRRDIEIELRAITSSFIGGLGNRFVPVGKLLLKMVHNELIDRQMADVIREVYSICSLVIHGEKATESQMRFVKKNGPELINALRAVNESSV